MNKINLLIAFFAQLVITSCSNSNSGEKPLTDSTTVIPEITDTVATTVNDIVRFKFDFAMGNTPSPAEVVNDMSTYKLVYNSAYLSDVAKVNSFKTDFSKALNLGMYNLDMAYAIANAQGADVLKYLKTSMSEINALGMKTAFDQFIGKRTETNINNKDSLLTIIDEMYVKGDSYLRTNQRVETATYIFIGSWIEALHIICSTGKDEKDAVQKARIRKLLWDQRFYLKNIIDLLEEFKSSKEAVGLRADLFKIHSEIDALAEPKDITEEKFKAICALITEERNKLSK